MYVRAVILCSDCAVRLTARPRFVIGCALCGRDKQTLKHHAEDMIMAGEKILRELAPTYTCVHCGAASPKDEWGPGRITCPKCKKVAPSAAESERAA
jgi:Zn finger protein HypA/HybF involved in hydrogenase expression